MQIVLPLLLLAMFYFFVLPRQRRAQAQRAMGATVEPGDQVITAGGMIGTVVSRDGERTTVEVAPGVEIEFLASAIVRRLEPSPDEAPYEDDTAGPYDDGGWHDKHVAESSPSVGDAAPTQSNEPVEPPIPTDVTRGDEHHGDATPPVAPRNEEI